MLIATRLCATTSILAILSGIAPATAQTIGAGLQPEYVIVTANQGRRSVGP